MLLTLTACSGNWITVTDEPITDDPSDEGGITVIDGTISIVYSSAGATVSGGKLVAFGGIESGSNISQSVIYVTNWTANASYSLYDGDKLLLEFTAPSKGGNGIVISHPDLVSGNSYTLKSGSSSSSVTASLNSQGGGHGGPGGWH